MCSIIGGMCLFFASSFVGLWVKRRYTEKARFYIDYYDYLNYAHQMISYERMALPDINKTFNNGKNSLFFRFLMKEKLNIPLNSQEKNAIREYLDSIGTTDADTQLNSLAIKSQQLKNVAEKDCKEWKEKGSLYFKLSVLAGIALFIIFV